MENNEESDKEKLFHKIVEERTHLVTELFSKPSKERRIQIEKRILELDKAYLALHE